jgi:hypothetical protein
VAARALVSTGPKGVTVYRRGGQRELRGLWGTVGMIDRLLHPDREQTSQ